MSLIGIGKLEKTSPKTISRHSFEPTIDVSKNSDPSPHQMEGQLSVDVYQTDEEIILITPIAGTSSDQISISVTEDILTIKGRREMNLKEKIRKENFYIQECFWGNFSRSVVLPAAVDTNRVEAHFKNNVLTIRIPKTELVKTRMIRIKEE